MLADDGQTCSGPGLGGLGLGGDPLRKGGHRRSVTEAESRCLTTGRNRSPPKMPPPMTRLAKSLSGICQGMDRQEKGTSGSVLTKGKTRP